MKICGKRIKECFLNVIICNDFFENRHYRNVDDIKTIFDLKLSVGGAEFVEELRGMDDEVVFYIFLLFNKTKRACVQQDQQ